MQNYTGASSNQQTNPTPSGESFNMEGCYLLEAAVPQGESAGKMVRSKAFLDLTRTDLKAVSVGARAMCGERASSVPLVRRSPSIPIRQRAWTFGGFAPLLFTEESQETSDTVRMALTFYENRCYNDLWAYLNSGECSSEKKSELEADTDLSRWLGGRESVEFVIGIASQVFSGQGYEELWSEVQDLETNKSKMDMMKSDAGLQSWLNGCTRFDMLRYEALYFLRNERFEKLENLILGYKDEEEVIKGLMRDPDLSKWLKEAQLNVGQSDSEFKSECPYLFGSFDDF